MQLSAIGPGDMGQRSSRGQGRQGGHDQAARPECRQRRRRRRCSSSASSTGARASRRPQAASSTRRDPATTADPNYRTRRSPSPTTTSRPTRIRATSTRSVINGVSDLIQCELATGPALPTIGDLPALRQRHGRRPDHRRDFTGDPTLDPGTEDGHRRPRGDRRDLHPLLPRRVLTSATPGRPRPSGAASSASART